jgi:hypothetical protein
MQSQISRRPLQIAMLLGITMLFQGSSIGMAAWPVRGASRLNVTVFKQSRAPAKVAVGAVVQIMNPNGTPRPGLSCTTGPNGKCTISNIPAISDGSLAYFVRVTHQGRFVDHYYRNGLFPNKPPGPYNQTVYVP